MALQIVRIGEAFCWDEMYQTGGKNESVEKKTHTKKKRIWTPAVGKKKKKKKERKEFEPGGSFAL